MLSPSPPRTFIPTTQKSTRGWTSGSPTGANCPSSFLPRVGAISSLTVVRAKSLARESQNDFFRSCGRCTCAWSCRTPRTTRDRRHHPAKPNYHASILQLSGLLASISTWLWWLRWLVRRTWPGMEIQRPEQLGDVLGMFCLEERMSRELYWAGFGFQIWLRLLTHISRSRGASLIVVDEPELYLHPDVRRQLLGILRDAGPDVLIATHSTEIMGEADPSEILLIDKTKRSAERLRDVEGVQDALDTIGSVQNITLTRLATNKRLLFVEGDSDYRLLRRFARKLSFTELAAGTDLTSLESGGFSSWERIRALAAGFEDVLRFELHVGAIFDRDYCCDEQIQQIEAELARHLEFSRLRAQGDRETSVSACSVGSCAGPSHSGQISPYRQNAQSIPDNPRAAPGRYGTDASDYPSPVHRQKSSRFFAKHVRIRRRLPNVLLIFSMRSGEALRSECVSCRVKACSLLYGRRYRASTP